MKTSGLVKILSNLFIFSVISFSACRKSDNPVSPAPGEGKWELIGDAGYGFGLGRIFFTDRQNGWIVGDSGKVKCTHDGGLSWTGQQSGTKADLNCIFFFDKNTGLTGGYSKTLLYTSNGGLNWNPVFETSGINSFIAGISYSGNILWLSDNQGRIYFSTDQGKNWQMKYDLPPNGYSYFKTFGNTFIASLFGGQNFKKSTDGGSSWNTYNNLPVRWNSNIFFLNDKLGWVTENNNPDSFHRDSSYVYYTSDGGENWKKMIAVKGIQTNHVYFSDANTGWFASTSDYPDTVKIYNTTDGGKSFNVQFEYTSKTMNMLSDLYFLDSSNAWALTFNGKIIRYSY
ncbi:MAG: WD40/YVTN/BNR-like repeat-containing protein [Syntrophomonadaceae bacterium]